jgi:hypothetical protein
MHRKIGTPVVALGLFAGSERIYPCPEGSGGGSARSIMPLLLNEVPRDARQSLRVSLSISS